MPKLTISPEDQALIAQLRAEGLEREAFDLEAAIARDQAASGRTMPLWGDPRFPAGTDSRWQRLIDSWSDSISRRDPRWMNALATLWEDEFQIDAGLAIQDMTRDDATKSHAVDAANVAWRKTLATKEEMKDPSFGGVFSTFMMNTPAPDDLADSLNAMFSSRGLDCEASARDALTPVIRGDDWAEFRLQIHGSNRDVVDSLGRADAYSIDSDGDVYIFRVDVDWENFRQAFVGYFSDVLLEAWEEVDEQNAWGTFDWDAWAFSKGLRRAASGRTAHPSSRSDTMRRDDMVKATPRKRPAASRSRRK